MIEKLWLSETKDFILKLGCKEELFLKSKVRDMVEQWRQTTHDRDVPGLILSVVKHFLSVCLMDIVGLPHKQLNEEANYFVMIIYPWLVWPIIVCKRLMLGRENKHSNKIVVLFQIKSNF